MKPLPSLLLAMCLVSMACGEQPKSKTYFGSAFPERHPTRYPALSSDSVLRQAPPFVGEDIFPCSECHDPDFMETDPTPRDLGDPHDTLPPLAHGAGRLWCLDCHDANNRDMLHLSSGETIPFQEAPRLCGQCHGKKYRDWLGGAHGKRTGHWQDGQSKEVWVCANCHQAHTPQFQSIQPEPAPKRPEVTR